MDENTGKVDETGEAAENKAAEDAAASAGAENAGKVEPETDAKPGEQDSSAKMKEQFVDVSKKVGKTLSEWGNKVAQKSGELIEQGKLEYKINTVERKIAKSHREAGEKLYNLWSQGRVEDRIVLDLIGEDLEGISGLASELATLRELLDNVKYQPKEGGEESEGKDSS